MLCQAGVLDSDYLEYWQPTWRRQVGAAAVIRDLALLTATLQSHTVNQPHALHRPTFLRFAAAARCVDRNARPVQYVN